MVAKIIEKINAEALKNDVPAFKIGDGVKVFVKIKEGNKERVQAFAGTVIARQALLSPRPHGQGRPPPRDLVFPARATDGSVGTPCFPSSIASGTGIRESSWPASMKWGEALWPAPSMRPQSQSRLRTPIHFLKAPSWASRTARS